MPSVTISRRGEDRARAGHPWIYRSDVVKADASAGDLVEVLGARGRPVAHALYSDRSEIALRIVAAGAAPPPAGLLPHPPAPAIPLRASLDLDAAPYPPPPP